MVHLTLLATIKNQRQTDKSNVSSKTGKYCYGEAPTTYLSSLASSLADSFVLCSWNETVSSQKKAKSFVFPCTLPWLLITPGTRRGSRNSPEARRVHRIVMVPSDGCGKKLTDLPHAVLKALRFQTVWHFSRLNPSLRFTATKRILRWQEVEETRMFSRHVTAAMSVPLNKGVLAILVSQTNPLGIKLSSYVSIEKHADWSREWTKWSQD